MRCKIDFTVNGVCLHVISHDGYESKQFDEIGQDGIIELGICSGNSENMVENGSN